jgi:hypothetical protein
MTLLEIQAAVNRGARVCWRTLDYEVVCDPIGQWLLIYRPTGDAIGLVWEDGRTMNGEPDDFFIPVF